MDVEIAEVEAVGERTKQAPEQRPDTYRYPAPEFPGCRTFRLRREELETYDGRFEYWDGDTETAWQVSEPTSATHERPSSRLAALCHLIAAVRGSAIECFGTMDLDLRKPSGERWRIMQADQSAYLHPHRARLPEHAMVIGEHDYPDVVLEVDHTTDVRRGKLGLYEQWGFPEVWVEVPERGSPSRRPGVLPGLTIHLLEDGAGGAGRYRTAPESRAFPGLTAALIHTVFNEKAPSSVTSGAIERVGRALGEREGTGPDDYLPLLRMHRQRARIEGRALGRAEGRAEQRAVLIGQATRRFGADTGERLSALLEGTDDPGVLADTGDGIIDCATGAELLRRVERSRNAPRAGNGT